MEWKLLIALSLIVLPASWLLYAAWRAGKNRERLEQLEKTHDAVQKVHRIDDRLRHDKRYAKRMRDRFRR